MKVNIFGLGYVGCASAACLANEGHEVTGIDIDNTKIEIINQGKCPIIEPGLEEAILTAVQTGKLRAASTANRDAEVSIVCVGTPSRENGGLDLTYVKKVSEEIGNFLKGIDHYHVINFRSTVLPGTIEGIVIPLIESCSSKRMGVDIGICMNPEFLREGSSMVDYYSPPFTLIGQFDNKSGDVVADLYKEIKAPLFRIGIVEAEMLKYTSNAFHALKVVFANEIGNICKKLGADSHEVLGIFQKDKKLNISEYYLNPGFAFGGSCLPKDLRAILSRAKENDLETPVLSSILPSNKNQIENAFQLVRKTECKKIGFLGLSFKFGTDDLRESPTVELIERLIGKGYSITIYDKEVSLAKIFGANKKYIETVIPHISSLLRESINEVISESELIVISKKPEDEKTVLHELKSQDKRIIDHLVNNSNYTQELGDKYEGICW